MAGDFSFIDSFLEMPCDIYDALLFGDNLGDTLDDGIDEIDGIFILFFKIGSITG